MDGRDGHLRIHVEGYAGHRVDEAPRAFVLGNRRIAVADERRVREPISRLCEDGALGIIEVPFSKIIE